MIIEAVESTTWKHRCVSLRCLCPQPSWQPAEAPRRLSCQLILHLSFLDDPMQRQMDRTRRPGSLPRSQDNLPTPCKLPLNSITAFITRYSVSTQAAEPHVGHIVCCCCLEQNKLSPPLNLNGGKEFETKLVRVAAASQIYVHVYCVSHSVRQRRRLSD